MNTISKKNNNFEKNSIVLFILMMVANVLNYLFQIISARVLPSVEDYAIINVIVSLYAILGVPSTVLALVSAKYTSAELVSGEQKFLTSIMRYLFRIVCIFIVVFFIVGVIISPIIADILQLDNRGYIYAIFFISTFLILGGIFVGNFQGKQDFFGYGIQNIINIGAKFIFSIVLIILGLKVWGVLISLLIGAILVFCYSAKNNKYFYSGDTCSLSSDDKKQLWHYIIEVLILQICITIIGNGDVVLVKSLFSGEETGIYSAASVVAKIATYISLALVATLFPIVSEKCKQKASVVPILIKSLSYVCLSVIGCAGSIIFLRKWIIKILFSDSYNLAIEYIPVVCFYVITLTLLIWAINFSMAMGAGKFVTMVLLFCCLCCILCAKMYHTELKYVIFNIGLILLITFILILFDIIIQNRRNLNEKES